MRVFVVCLSLPFFLASCASQPSKDAVSSNKPRIAFSRYFSFTTCYKGQAKCIGPVVEDLAGANVKAELEKFSKGGESGVTAFDSNRVERDGIPFNSEIRITKKESSDAYYVYMMLRSDPTTSRQGVVKTFELKNISSFKSVTITDTPIKFDGGELRAELTFGQPLKISK